MNDKVELALITGLISLALAIVSGIIAYLTARSNSRRDIAKMQAQLDAQREATERERIADLRQRYVTPLRYYASTLSYRFSEVEAKFRSVEDGKFRDLFKKLKDHVAGDLRRPDFGVWPYYEGLFPVTTLYYTCAYFQLARDIRYSLPFLRDNPFYSERLNECLIRVRASFYWDSGEKGIWDALQEVIGERFAQYKMGFESMLGDLAASDQYRRGPFLRPLDFFWSDLSPDKTREIRGALDVLVAFLDSSNPGSRAGASGSN